jgi:hypothetical protein
MVEDFDGGGIRVYSGKHIAARQFGEQAEIRWHPHLRLTMMAGVLYQAHNNIAGDWIPFKRYSRLLQPGPPPYICRGPKFLMEEYARWLTGEGEEPSIQALKQKSSKPLKVLHLGNSSVVAEKFSAARSE